MPTIILSVYYYNNLRFSAKLYGFRSRSLIKCQTPHVAIPIATASGAKMSSVILQSLNTNFKDFQGVYPNHELSSFSSINPLYPCVDVGKADDLLTDGWRRWCGPQGQIKCDTFWGELFLVSSKGSTASQVTLERQYVQKSVVCIGTDRSGWFHHESLWSCPGQIIFEDQSLIAIAKPAGKSSEDCVLVTQEMFQLLRCFLRTLEDVVEAGHWWPRCNLHNYSLDSKRPTLNVLSAHVSTHIFSNVLSNIFPLKTFPRWSTTLVWVWEPRCKGIMW